MIITAIIPIIFTVALGYLLERWRTMDVRVLATITIYALLPCLIFDSLLTTELTLGQALPIVYVLFFMTMTLWVIGKFVSRLRRLNQEEESYLLLTTMFLNAGNMGMPVALYAFGKRGLDLAIIAVLTENLLMNTLAVYYSSRHRNGHREAVRTIFSLPSIYAATAALLLRAVFRQTLPSFLQEHIHLLGMATIPVAQLLLGIQLAKARSQVHNHLARVIGPNVVRLILGPAIAFAFVTLLGVHGLTAKIAILICAMPSAVNVAIYTTEFGLLPKRIATTVFTSTAASFVTISALLLLLGR